MYFTVKEKPVCGPRPPELTTRDKKGLRIIPTNTHLMWISKCQVSLRERGSLERGRQNKTPQSILSSWTYSSHAGRDKLEATGALSPSSIRREQPRPCPDTCPRVLRLSIPVALPAARICRQRGRSSSKTQKGSSPHLCPLRSTVAFVMSRGQTPLSDGDHLPPKTDTGGWRVGRIRLMLRLPAATEALPLPL